MRLLLENEPVCTVAHAEPLLDILDRYHGQGLGLWLDVANLHEIGQATPETVKALARMWATSTSRTTGPRRRRAGLLPGR